MNKSSKLFDYLIKVSKRMMDKKYKDRITEVVQRLEQNGGKVSDYKNLFLVPPTGSLNLHGLQIIIYSLFCSYVHVSKIYWDHFI